MAIAKFSVGKILIDGVPVGVANNISVRHDGNPQEFRGGDYRFPLCITPGDQSLVVSAETADFDANEPDFNAEVTLELQQGANSGGLTATFTNMKLVSAEVTSEQNSFVATRLEWRKFDVVV
jgi:hypothetical protein